MDIRAIKVQAKIWRCPVFCNACLKYTDFRPFVNSFTLDVGHSTVHSVDFRRICFQLETAVNSTRIYRGYVQQYTTGLQSAAQVT